VDARRVLQNSGGGSPPSIQLDFSRRFRREEGILTLWVLTMREFVPES